MKRLKRFFLLNGLIASYGASLIAADVSSPRKPNVVLIMADDVGFECINAYGSTYHTPNINRMASQGMLFANCHSQPLSTPSRVQLMTGKYNHRNYTHFAYLDPKEKTFAHLAKEAGYATCIAGKWQLGYDSRLPKVFGFDSHCLWQLSQEREKGERYANPLYELEGQIMERDSNLYGPDIFARHIMDFIRENKDTSFFAYYPMALCHDPFFPTPDSEEWASPQSREKAHLKYFSEMVSYMDKIVGEILDCIEKEGLSDNTLVIFTGDNGTNVRITTPMQDGSEIPGGKKGTKFNATHVPLIIRGPGIEKGINKNLIDFSDFYPTLRDIFGLPSNEAEILDGLSFYPQLSDPATKNVRQWSFCHYQDQTKPDYIRFVQTLRYKLYQDGRFYNIEKDRYEADDIQNGSPQEEAVRLQLSNVLKQYELWGKDVLVKSGN